MGSGLLEYSCKPNPEPDAYSMEDWFRQGNQQRRYIQPVRIFQKYIYTGGQWQETDTIESAVYQFRSAKLTPTGTPGADGTYGTGGQTGSDPDATITGEASATSSNGGNGTRSKNAVSTADNSPIGTMSALAVASLLAGGYVIVRRRKKNI